jgi:hypothetical protein
MRIQESQSNTRKLKHVFSYFKELDGQGGEEE